MREGKARAIKGTNIEVRALQTPEDHENFTEKTIALLKSIDADDRTEELWLRTLRPERSLIHPAEAFLQGIKKLRPALDFNTFDLNKAKKRRVAKRERDQAVAQKRRDAKMVPTAAMRAINARKQTRTGGHATEEEVRFLSRGKPNQRALAHIAAFQTKKKKVVKQQSEGDLPEKEPQTVERKMKKPRHEKLGHRI